MKKITIALSIIFLSLSSCIVVGNQDRVKEINYYDEDRDRITTHKGDFIVVPHDLYNVGDTIKFCK